MRLSLLHRDKLPALEEAALLCYLSHVSRPRFSAS